jgi:transposase-like protein
LIILHSHSATGNRSTAFPTEASVLKIFYLVLGNIAKKWTMPIRCWKSAVNQLAIKFADRMLAE